MVQLILNCPAKLNLYLHITKKRADGYHNLESFMVPINWFDKLKIESVNNNKIIRTGDLVSLPEDDLCLKAANELKDYSGTNYGCKIHLKKNIPVGSGLGGGSSNAASTLLALNKIWSLHLPKKLLFQIAKNVGADVPFFISQHSAYIAGIGDKVLPIKMIDNLPQHFLVIVPDLKVKTKFIFENLKLDKFTKENKFLDFLNLNHLDNKQNIGNKPIWKYGKNDLEETACYHFPIIKKYIDLLKYVAKPFGIDETSCRLSGSGGAIFCSINSKKNTLEIFERLNEAIKKNRKLKNTKLKICKLNTKIYD